jgi:hypothetical protein
LYDPCGDFLDGSFQNLSRFVDFIGFFEDIGIAKNEYLVVGILIVGQTIEVFSFLVIQGFVFFLGHLEEGLERQLLEFFALHQQ